MENSKNVQLHEIIKNSLATYLSYKWSADKLYLKKRKKKDQKDENQKKKRSCSLDKQRSIINLENNVFIYDAKNKTFTQLDLCDCFKNGLKYRKIDPFATKSIKKKYELCELPQNSPEGLQEYQSFQLIDVKDSVEHIFSNQLMKRENWTKTINNLCPSKFDLFIQKELNKCTGKNFDVKSFKINAKQESSTSSNDKVCSSAAIGYYTITTYDDALTCENHNNKKGKKMSTKQCNFIGIREETVCPKKLYSKGLQCKLSNHHQLKREKVSSTKDLGVQCFCSPTHQAEGKSKKSHMDEKMCELRSENRNAPKPRQKNLGPKKLMRKKHGSLSDLFPHTECKNVGNMIQINSSAEIRKILNDESDSSLTLSNTGEFFKTFMSPKPLMAYYQTSSTSKDNRGDTNDEQYTRNEVRVMTASNNEQFSNAEAIVITAESNHQSPICSEHCNKNVVPKVPTCTCTYEDTKHRVPVVVEKSLSSPRIQAVCSSKCTGPCSAARKAAATLTCPSICPCAGQKRVEKRNPNMPCVCPPPPRKACCECNKDISASCICDLLCSLKERIKKQTEEQNRNLDQILEELDKQDKEIQLIRQYVEKTKKTKKSKCCKKNAVCSCYAATVQYDFNGIPAGAPDKVDMKMVNDGPKDIIEKKSVEPEIIQIFGSEKKIETKKHIHNVFEKDSWKALWKRNSRVLFVNDFFFKKRNNLRKKFSSSSNGQNEISQSKRNRKDKKDYKQWFSKLVCSKKDLRKNVS